MSDRASVKITEEEEGKTNLQTIEDESTNENVNEFGDDFSNHLWDGPEDSDEEIEEMVKYKTQWEIDNGIKYSKKGIIETIEKYLKYESTESDDAKNGRLWE